MEIFATLLIVAAAGYIIYKSVKKSAKGKCNCNSCNTGCPLKNQCDE